MKALADPKPRSCATAVTEAPSASRTRAAHSRIWRRQAVKLIRASRWKARASDRVVVPNCAAQPVPGRDLIDPLLASDPLGIDYACRLELSPRSLAELEITAWRHLEAVAPAPELAAELDRILDDGRLHSCTDAGTVLLTARFP